MAGDVDDVIHSSHHPEIAIVISARPIPSEVEVRSICRANGFPIALPEALGIAMNGAHHAWPRGSYRQVSALVWSTAIALCINDVRLDSREGQGGRAWLGGGRSRERADHYATGFGLPPGVHDGAASTAHHIAVPHPGFRVDRFTDSAQQAQAAHVVLIRHRAATPHKGANGCRCGVENADPVFLDQLPERSRLRGARSTLVHHCGGAVRQRPINDVTVSGDPAHIGRTPKHIIVTDVENPLKGQMGPEVVTRRGVDHTFGFSCRSRGIEHKQPVFARHGLRDAGIRLRGDHFVPPQISPRHHLHLLVRAFHNKHGLHRWTGTIGERCIHSRFQGYGLVFPETAIGCDHRFDVTIDQAITQGFG